MIKLSKLIRESKYDRVVTEISRIIFNKLKNNPKKFKFEYQIKDIILLIEVNIQKKKEVELTDKAYVEGYSWVSDLEQRIGQLEINILTHPNGTFKDYANYVHAELKEVLTHELEHILQQLKTPGRQKVRKADVKDDFDYLKGMDEVEGFVVGLYKRAKVEHKPLGDLIDGMVSIYVVAGDITKDQGEKIKKKWKEYAKKRFPKAQL